MGKDENNTLYFSSEMKCLVDNCIEIKEFPPGHYMTNIDNNPKKILPKKLDEF